MQSSFDKVCTYIVYRDPKMNDVCVYNLTTAFANTALDLINNT